MSQKRFKLPPLIGSGNFKVTLMMACNVEQQAVGPLAKMLDAQRLVAALQPIVDTYRGTLLGVESLIRGPQHTTLCSPAEIFAAAQQERLDLALEQYCYRAAFAAYQRLNSDSLLFINCNPNLLPASAATLLKLCQTMAIAANQVVLELSEKHPIDDFNDLSNVLMMLRTEGFKIAIDDFGVGYSSMQLWSEVRPEFVKIDRYFIHGIHQNPFKREFVNHLVGLAKNLHATLIAEGVEHLNDYREIQRCGISSCQGFLLAEPRIEGIVLDELVNVIPKTSAADRHESVSSLIQPAVTVPPNSRTINVLNAFEQQPELIAILVVAEQQARGIIRRGQFMELMSSAYGRALYANKPIEHLMQRDILILDASAPLEMASALLTEHDENVNQQVIVIVDNQQYVGVVPIAGLLRRITELRIQNARYANPLTLLPGNVLINQCLDDAIQASKAFCALYFDLNHFKAFNDVYGYAQGDRVLQWFADLLKNYFASPAHEPDDNFIGHVGGDDYVVVVPADFPYDERLSALTDDFEDKVRGFYRAEHIRQSGMVARARNGKFQRFSLLSFAVGIVPLGSGAYYSHLDIAEAASVAKHRAKRRYNHRYVMSLPGSDQQDNAAESAAHLHGGKNKEDE